MVKSELVHKLCDIHPNVLRKDMEKIVEVIVQEILEALRRNEAVEIRGFGRFKVINRKARVGRNPKNSSAVNIPAKRDMKWKMSKILYERLNNNFSEKSKFSSIN